MVASAYEKGEIGWKVVDGNLIHKRASEKVVFREDEILSEMVDLVEVIDRII